MISLSKHVEVVVSIAGRIIVLDSSSCMEHSLPKGPFEKIALSPNGKLIGLFNTVVGKLFVYSSDFQRSLAEISINSTSKPLQMEWCGADSIVLCWESSILVVGPLGDWLKYSYPGRVHLTSEVDGLRMHQKYFLGIRSSSRHLH
jgi:hypothetical protein